MVRDCELAGAEKTLADVHTDNIFSLKDGSQVNNLKELYMALQKMDDSTFSHHVNDSRHDFSNWVKDVHRDYKLANSLEDTKDKKDCAHVIGNRIYELQKTIEQRKSMALKETEIAAARLEKILTEAARANSKVLSSSDKDVAGQGSEVIVTDMESGASEVVKEKIESPLPKKPCIRNEPFRLKKHEPCLNEDETSLNELFNISGVDSVISMPNPDVDDSGPSAEELLEEESASADDQIEELGLIEHEDSVKELIEFTEEPKFHKKFAKEMSTVFTKEGLSDFKDDMKKIFHSGNEAEHRFLKQKLSETKEDSVEKEADDVDVPAPEPKIVAGSIEDTIGVEAEPPKPVKASVSDKKQEMLLHLKRVFK